MISNEETFFQASALLSYLYAFSLDQVTEHSKFNKKFGTVVKYRPKHFKAGSLTPAAASGNWREKNVKMNLFKLSSFIIIKPYFISGTFALSNAEAGKPY
jgi:hypothetical protein